ncbi:hypothetical protein EOD39_15141 [Acipenser ruthenus]|uniref:tRNA-splicing endonuclease subunit Sen15 domain-containing protein n=1 Tax=Acipenser ruthenus TaxID=7906 RepID=A0A662YLL4_ACIRT|nr:hypothetical protein EOD39_15141 [Acipenser ruthenus]
MERVGGSGGSAEESGDVAETRAGASGTEGDIPGNWILQHHKPGSDGAPSPSLLLAAVAPDSTLAYYRFSRGFVVPEPPDSIQALECGCERRKRRRL